MQSFDKFLNMFPEVWFMEIMFRFMETKEFNWFMTVHCFMGDAQMFSLEA